MRNIQQMMTSRPVEVAVIPQTSLFEVPYSATINRQKDFFFFTFNRQTVKRLTVKKFQGISNFAISSADLHGILAPKEFIYKLEKHNSSY